MPHPYLSWKRLIVTAVVLPWACKLAVQCVFSPSTALLTLIFFPVELLSTSRVLWILSLWGLPSFLLVGVAARAAARRLAASAVAGERGMYTAVLAVSAAIHLYLWQDILRGSTTGVNPFDLLAYLPLYCLVSMPVGYVVAARVARARR